MKILWLTPYPINNLKEKIKHSTNANGHSCSWIVNLAGEIVKDSKINLNILSANPHINKTQYAKIDGVNYFIIKNGLPIVNRGFPNWFPFDTICGYKVLNKRIMKYINTIKPDIIHVHGTEKNYGLITSKIKYPSIVSIQGVVNEIAEYTNDLRLTLQKRIEKKIIETNSNFGCRTDFDRKIVKSINPNAKIFYVGEAISNIYFNHKWEFSNKKTLLFVGSVCKRKGIEELIRAVFLLNQRGLGFNLEIIGSGTKKYIVKLKKKINYYHIHHKIKFLGHCDASTIAYKLSSSSFFVLPSYIENSPNSLAEALAVGTPAIASDVGGISSMITDKLNGFIIPKKDSESIVKIISAAHNNIEMLNSISIKARERAYKTNHPALVKKNLINVYKNIIEGYHE